ncbi:hypothetical protein PR001_g24641 [Phytophthora rubi]|uniref:Secreted protein n=1 Tax=Phytophthora rubi TaxID=129364 RepID=A0A6A3IAT6_9STRA|nr:hypothetical protein PR001_g24641 [Phytophthora rubi]
MAPPWVMLMVVVLAHRECEHTCGSNTPHPKVDGKWGVVTSKCVHSTPSGKKLMDIEYYTTVVLTLAYIYHCVHPGESYS